MLSRSSHQVFLQQSLWWSFSKITSPNSHGPFFKHKTNKSITFYEAGTAGKPRAGENLTHLNLARGEKAVPSQNGVNNMSIKAFLFQQTPPTVIRCISPVYEVCIPAGKSGYKVIREKKYQACHMDRRHGPNLQVWLCAVHVGSVYWMRRKATTR